MKTLLSDEVSRLQNAIIRKRDDLNEQDIDDEILGYISIYKHGSKQYRERAKKVLVSILVNSGMVRKISDIIINDWSDEE